MEHFKGALALLIGLLLAGPAPAAPGAFIPDGRIRPDDYTVLMAVDAPQPEGCRPFQPGGHGKFFLEGWSRPGQVFRWEVVVPSADAYAVSVLARRKSAASLAVKVSCAGQSVGGRLAGAEWERLALDGTLALPAGRQTLALEATGAGFDAEVMSVELVRPAVRERLRKEAQAQRADTGWMRQAGYGLMAHWTSESCPRSGPRRPYAEAVKAFDVGRFADQVQATGAGFLVFTTSHAEMYFPAPIEALDRILPGRTTERDLVAELAKALEGRGIKLMLYYHLGSASDPVWLRACGFWETDTRKLFGNWTAVVGEIGQRYGSRLVGWWFDDGSISYYYRNAPWAALTRAAKSGNANRAVGYNPWVLPLPTEFQDFHCGEGFHWPADPRNHRDGLQACATLIAENDWGHFRQDSEIGAPRWTAEPLAENIRQFAAHKVVPIFNLEIYQEGALSPRTVEVFRQAGRLLK